uniref:RNA-directed RNA polymerase n=1 Tax=Caenorhabditis tropicalis TaxID=1561998 RepID=A0A1I7U5U4_9PELO
MGEEGYRGWIKLEVPCSGQERQMGSIIRCHTSKLEPALNNLGMRIQTRGQVQVAEEQDCEPFYEANYEVVSYRFSHDLINAIQNYLKDLMTDHLMPFQRRNLVLHSSDFWSSELMCHIPEIPLAAIFFGNIQGGTFINHWEVSFWENTNRRHRDRIRNATPHVADKIGLNQIKVEFEFEFDKVDFMTIHFKHKEQDFEVTDKDQKRSRHENLLRALQTDLTNDMVRISNRQPQDPNVFIRSFATTTNAIAVVNTITAFRNLGFETVNPQNVEQELNFIKQATAIAVMDVIKDKNISCRRIERCSSRTISH